MVCVNAGHGTNGGGSVKTQCHPDGSAKVTGGTTGAGATSAVAVSSGMTFADGTAESKVTLAMAKVLKTKLLNAGWDVQYFWVALGLAVGGGILNSFGGIVGVIGSLALLGTALMNVVALYKLACAYGHGIGFTIGLFFLNPLFMLILGFGDSEYMGPQE